MKKALLLLTLSLSIWGYSQSFKQEIAKNICHKLKDFSIANKNKKQIEFEFGAMLITSAMDYAPQIEKELGIDIKKEIGNQEAMENLGIEIGILLATECPESFAKVVGVHDGVQGSTDSLEVELISGKIVKVSKENFVVFHVKGDNGILHKFYWVGNIESNIDLPSEYKKLKGKNVFIGFHKNIIFDTKIDAYRTINEIHHFNLDDE